MRDLFSSATGRLCHSMAISAASALGISRRLRFSRAASRASRTASLASAKPEPTSEIFGPSSIGSFAKLDQHTRWLKTSQGYAAPMGDDFLAEYSETWPKAGTMRSGSVYPLPTWAHRTSASASGLWPTPNAGNFNEGEDLGSWLVRRERVKQATNNGNGFGMPLSIAVQLAERQQWPTPSASPWRSGKASDEVYNRNSRPLNEVVAREFFATPQARDHRTGMPERWKDEEGRQNLNDQVGGLLNPTWVELLMGFPPGWVTGNAEPPEPPSDTPAASTS